MTKFACPCCGFLTLPLQPPGSFELCPVCFWEDDDVAFREPNFRGGANTVSLNEARTNFRRMGACDESARAKVRSPRPEEVPPA